MVSVCLPCDALLQQLLSYLGFSYLGRGVSLHGCSSKAQPLLLTLDKRYLLTAGPPDLERGIAPLGPSAPAQPLLNITVIQVCAPTSNAEEAEVERFYEDLQDLLELTPPKDVLFIIGDWNAKLGNQERPGITGKFGLGVQNKGGQS